MLKKNELCLIKIFLLVPFKFVLITIVYLTYFNNVNASDFLNERKAASLNSWKKEMKSSYPPVEVLLTTRYFIRNVLAKNQQFIMTNDVSYWNKICEKYGGKQTQIKNNHLEQLYDFNWYVFHELNKYRKLTLNKSKQFFTDYAAIIDLFCIKVPDSVIVKYFFETYYTDWIIFATYNREYLPRLKPVIDKAISDLPKELQAIGELMDTLKKILPEPQKRRYAIDSIINSANRSFLKNNKCYLTFNLFSGKKIEGIINAFLIEDEFSYPFKISKDTINLSVLKLKCIDNLNLTISTPGYFYKKQVFIFPDNQPYAWHYFSEYFKGTKPFPLLDLFVCDTTIQSYYDNGMVTESGFNELMYYHEWLKNGDGKLFINAINKLCKTYLNLTFSEWVEKVEISLLLHEVVGHGGTFCNKVIKETDISTFEYHVESEFFAYLLQYIYSPVQGFDLACMFSHMSNPLYFSNQYNEAYLKICNEILISISKNKNIVISIKKWEKSTIKDDLKNVAKNFKKFETLGYQDRIKYCLFPLVSFLNKLNQEERSSIFRSIYFRNTDKPIPEPIIAPSLSNHQQ